MEFDGLNSTQLEALASAAFEPLRVSRLTPYLLGLMFDGLLQGIVFCQFATWWSRSYTSEKTSNRLLAIWLLLCGVAYTVVQAARSIHIFAYGYGRYLSLLEEQWALVLILILLLVHIPAEAFYIARAYALSNKNKGLLAFLSALWLSVCATGIACLANFPAIALAWKPLRLFTAVSSLISVTDIFITLIIVYLLWRRRTGEQSSDRLVSKLALDTAAAMYRVCHAATFLGHCASTDISAIVLCGLDATNHVWVSPVIVPIMCKLSIMAIFTVLNSRRALRKEFLPRTMVLPPQSGSVPSSLFPASTPGRHATEHAVMEYAPSMTSVASIRAIDSAKDRRPQRHSGKRGSASLDLPRIASMPALSRIQR